MKINQDKQIIINHISNHKNENVNTTKDPDTEQIELFLKNQNNIHRKSNYDISNISYNELKDFAKILLDTGMLDARYYLDFIGPDPKYGNIDSNNQDSDLQNKKINYLTLWEQRLEHAKKYGGNDSQVKHAAHMLALFNKFGNGAGSSV